MRYISISDHSRFIPVENFNIGIESDANGGTKLEIAISKDALNEAATTFSELIKLIRDGNLIKYYTDNDQVSEKILVGEYDKFYKVYKSSYDSLTRIYSMTVLRKRDAEIMLAENQQTINDAYLAITDLYESEL